MTDPQLDLARRALQLRDQTIKKERIEMTDDLIQQLRAAGFDAAADNVRDTMIAKQLHDAGRSDLAENLEQGVKPKPNEQPEVPQPTEGEEFIQELRDLQEAQWTSAGKLIGD